MSKPYFDPGWVERAKNGDQEAFGELYSYSHQAAYIVILTMVRADEDAVMDLVQDTYLKVYQRLDQLESPSKFRAWVKQIARNTALDYIKKSRVLAFSELYVDEEMEVEVEDPDTEHLPDIVMDRQETARLLHEILDTLPDAQRAVISMHYLQGIPVKEIAATLGRSENTIKVQLFQGRKSLEAKIREMEKKNDIKLYSFAPMAFLSLLVRVAEEISVQPDLAMLEKIFGVEVASAGSTATASAAAARTAVSNIVGKIVAVVAAVALGGGAIGVYMALNQPPAEMPTEPTVQVVETIAPTEDATEPTEEPTEAVLYDYEQLIVDYADIISGEIPIDEAGIDLSQSALWVTPSGCIIDENGYFVSRGTVRFSFVKIDLDGDQVDELISLEEYKIGDDEWRGTILDIFTMKNDVPTWLIAGAYRGYVDIFTEGIIRRYSSGGASYAVEEYFELCEGELVPAFTGIKDGDAFSIDGVDCSEEKYYATVDQFDPILALDLERHIFIQP